MPRDLIKEIIDIKGYKKNDVVSIPIAFGIERASIISGLFLGVLCILLPLPYILEILSVKYMIVVLFFAYPIIIYCLIKLVKKPVVGEFSKLSRFLKFAMATGLVAMFI